jgi:hypothetical protein
MLKTINIAVSLIDVFFIEVGYLLLHSIEICPRHSVSYYWLTKFNRPVVLPGTEEKKNPHGYLI